MRSLGERVTGWRRVAGAMWHAPDDPQIAWSGSVLRALDGRLARSSILQGPRSAALDRLFNALPDQRKQVRGRHDADELLPIDDWQTADTVAAEQICRATDRGVR